eukprot:COSAG04_NODE_1756_length_5675_cov_3.546449_5_plen_350_part_00
MSALIDEEPTLTFDTVDTLEYEKENRAAEMAVLSFCAAVLRGRFGKLATCNWVLPAICHGLRSRGCFFSIFKPRYRFALSPGKTAAQPAPSKFLFPEGSGAGISTPSASADPLLAGAGTAASAVVGCSRERARAASSALADIVAGSHFSSKLYRRTWAGALAAGGRQLSEVGPEALVSLHQDRCYVLHIRNHHLPNFVKFPKGRQESARPGQLTRFLTAKSAVRRMTARTRAMRARLGRVAPWRGAAGTAGTRTGTGTGTVFGGRAAELAATACKPPKGPALGPLRQAVLCSRGETSVQCHPLQSATAARPVASQRRRARVRPAPAPLVRTISFRTWQSPRLSLPASRE